MPAFQTQQRIYALGSARSVDRLGPETWAQKQVQCRAIMPPMFAGQDSVNSACCGETTPPR